MVAESRLTFIEDLGSRKGYKYGRYLCTCGSTAVVQVSKVGSGHTKSCGCLQRQRASESATTHGETGKSPEYRAWQSMKRRCTNRNTKDYPYYGGRGITVAAEWGDSFEQFLSDMGRRPTSLHTLERVLVDGEYSAANCVWATRKEQANNRRTNNVISAYGGHGTLSQWTDALEVPKNRISDRLALGWSDHDALFTPKGGKRG